MVPRLLAASIVLAAGCFGSEAKLAPDAPPPLPDAAGGADAAGDPDAAEPTLPAGFRLVAEGNYLQLAPKIIGGLAYAVEYAGAGLTAQPQRIVSIDVATGAVQPIHTLPAGQSPLDLQANATSLFWLQRDTAGTTLYRKIGSGAPVAIVSPTAITPAGYKLDTYVAYGDSGKVYLLFTNGANFELGVYQAGTLSVTDTGGPSYTQLVTGALPNTTSLSFSSGWASTIAPVGAIVYAGGRAGNAGVVVRFDTHLDPPTFQIVRQETNTVPRGFLYSGTRAHWLIEHDDLGAIVSLHDANPIGTGSADDRTVAQLDAGAYDFVGPVGDGQGAALYYVASLGAHDTSLTLVTLPSSGAATTTALGTLATCPASAALDDCVVKIPSVSIATDGDVVLSTTTAVYAYTP